SVVARGAGHRNRRHPARGREQRSGAPAGGPRRPAAGGRGLPRGGPVAGPLPPVPAADGAGTGLLAARHAAVRPLAARRLGDAELDAQDFALRFARPFLDTLPFAGWLNGHTTATGPVSGLTLDVDWTFRDSLVPGRPETRIRGRGDVALGGGAGGDLRFQPFTVKAVVDLGTVERLVP